MKHPGGGGAAGGGHSAKHTRSKKHVHGKGKHHPKHQPQGHHAHQGGKVHTVAGHAHHPRGLAIGDALPVCTFEALAMSLRLLGHHVPDDDLAGLWELAGCPEEGVGIGEALTVVAQHGTGGVRPGQLDYRPLRLPPGSHDGLFGFRLGDPPGEPRSESGIEVHALILGVDWPGPHAVLATPGGWWSWGRLWSPWTTAVSEAWEVAWS